MSLLLPTPDVALLPEAVVLLDELPDSLPALLPELFGCSLVALPVLFVSNDPPWNRFVSLPDPYTLEPDDPCDPLLGLVDDVELSLPWRDCWSVELELLLLELLFGLVPDDVDELDESGLVLEELLSELVEEDDELVLGLVPITPLALPEIVESCEAVPVAVPPCGYCDELPLCSDPELDVAELPCDDDEGVELSVTLPETLELEDDEPGVVEFNEPLVEPLGAPEPEVLIDVLL